MLSNVRSTQQGIVRKERSEGTVVHGTVKLNKGMWTGDESARIVKTPEVRPKREHYMRQVCHGHTRDARTH